MVSMDIKIKQGVAVKVRNTVHVGGGGKDGHVSTTHISIFQIDGKPVQVESNRPVIIDENDVVAVAGELKNGIFMGSAYKNFSVGVSGDEGVLSWLLLGTIFPIVGLTVMVMYINKNSGLVALGGLVFFVAGIYMFLKAMKINKASNELKTIDAPVSSLEMGD